MEFGKQYIKTFNTEAEYTAFKASSGYNEPNVSYISGVNAVHYNPYKSVTGVTLNESSISLSVGDAPITLVATVLPADANDKSVTWSSSNSNIATVSSSGVVTAVSAGTCTITVTTNDGGFTAQCSTTIIDPYAGHDYVDLGLTSGTKWATMNIGATATGGTSSYGNYYQYGKGSAQYAATSGDSDYNGNENPLATSADTAAQVWGGSWHTPTSAQCQEIINECEWSWTGMGYLVRSRKNSNYIFLPVAGRWNNGSQEYVGTEGYYWTSIHSSPYSTSLVYRMYIKNGGKSVSTDNRNKGYSIRPVVG